MKIQLESVKRPIFSRENAKINIAEMFFHFYIISIVIKCVYSISKQIT